jgi:methylated-DNA-[protein]-cysteine S-methyltransferase
MKPSKKHVPTFDPKQYTAFQIAVYQAVSKIPSGETRTYKQIAEMIGYPKAFRAVGSALKKNPYPHPGPVPCHRVIASNGKIGGFFGQTNPASPEVRRKQRLLLEETRKG